MFCIIIVLFLINYFYCKKGMFIIVVFVILYIFYFEVYDFLEYDVKYFLILKCFIN